MWVKRGQASRCLIVNIVVVRGTPLNAHFCQCLAHFSRVLEKCNKFAHNQNVIKCRENHVL
ncbi:hypothetical protein E6X08_09605 [Escherichia fergusonii]|nr:hypothetical protein [Escherichia fergusonii]KWV99112.1 hypothetical protein VK87_0221180 [Escherichia fergusonii]KWW01639.1 hypothetical protein VP22_0207530 [Escherichia fergusonii]RSK66897.1 hypothetical protein D7Z29_16245 [Escherichia fergusonii]